MYKKTLFLLVMYLLIGLLLSACGGDAEGDIHEHVAGEATTAEETVQAGAPGTWLVMLYQNADDEVLEQDIFTDLNEA